jgi:transposase-like protein
MPTQRRKYLDADRALALAALDANDGRLGSTARRFGIPATTLRRWANGRTRADLGKLVAEQKAGLAWGFEEVARKLLNLTPEKIQRAGLLKAAMAAGICVEKMLLLRAAAREAGICERCRCAEDGGR